MVVAYAVALQLLLGGLTVAHQLTAVGSPFGDAFATCLGGEGGAVGNQGDPQKRPVQNNCIVCSLAHLTVPTLVGDQGTLVVVALSRDIGLTWIDDRTVAFASPTGRYQRGPPADAMLHG